MKHDASKNKVYVNIEQASQLAQDENTPSEILDELSLNPKLDDFVLQYVASNPNTSTWTLHRLGGWFPEAVIANPIFNLLLLENPESKFVKLSLARSSTTSSTILEKLAISKDRGIVIALANNSNFPERLLDKLIKNQSLYILESMTHPIMNTSIKVLNILAAHSNAHIRQLVAQHPRLSIELFQQLSLDNQSNVRQAVAKILKHHQKF